MWNLQERKGLLIKIKNRNQDVFCSSQKLTDFPVEAINMLDYLTMFIHYAELPIKVSD